MTSVNTMIKKISGLQDTNRVTAWENEFISSVVTKTRDGLVVSTLTDKEIDKVEQIHATHFA